MEMAGDGMGMAGHEMRIAMRWEGDGDRDGVGDGDEVTSDMNMMRWRWSWIQYLLKYSNMNGFKLRCLVFIIDGINLITDMTYFNANFAFK